MVVNTHLAIIAKLLEKHGVRDRMELASLAKREETIHREGHDDIILDDAVEFWFMQEMRLTDL